MQGDKLLGDGCWCVFSMDPKIRNIWVTFKARICKSLDFFQTMCHAQFHRNEWVSDFDPVSTSYNMSIYF